MINNTAKIGIIGFGAWSTALANILSINAQHVVCYTQRAETALKFSINNINEESFPGIALPRNITVTQNFNDLMDAAFLCLCIPTQNIREVMGRIYQTHGALLPPIVICSKGLEIGSCQLISEILQDIGIESRIAVLSGPNFASEIIHHKPASTTIACLDTDFAEKLSHHFTTQYFTVEVLQDMIGTQICGAFKNVIAIAAGMSKGLDLGHNHYAALLTQGLREMRTLVDAMGGDTVTINSFAGVGDLILTCSSTTSRNTKFGYQVGITQDRSVKRSNSTVEGFYSTKSFKDLADSLNIDLNILNKTYSILYEGAEPKELMK